MESKEGFLKFFFGIIMLIPKGLLDFFLGAMTRDTNILIVLHLFIYFINLFLF